MNTPIVPQLQQALYHPPVKLLRSEDDLAMLGRDNLAWLSAAVASVVDSERYGISLMHDKVRLLGLSADARQVESGPRGPADIEMSDVIVPGTSVREVRTLLRRGDTTFRACGACAHRSGGMAQGETMLSGSCGLLDSGPGTEARVANSPCGFDSLSETAQAGLVAAELERIAAREAKVQGLEALSARLASMAEASPADEPRVLLPGFRATNRYREGEALVGFIGTHPARTVEADWIQGVAVSGHRHHDGFVWVQAREAVHNDPRTTSDRHLSYFYQSVFVMSLAEFEALRAVAASTEPTDQRFFELWFTSTAPAGLALSYYQDKVANGRVLS